MKTKLKLLGVLMLVIATAFTASAYDFYVGRICYNKLSDTEVEVTYTDYNSYRGRVTIPASVTYNDTTYSVTSIGDYAFSYCSGPTSVTIPNSVTSIGDYAFCGCSGLTSVTIPNSVTSIGDWAFFDCSGLKSVHITDLAAWCKIEFSGGFANPLFYAHTLYLNGEKVTDLVIPKSTTAIKNYTFCGCSSFTSIAMPNSVTSIGDYAFRGCSGLTSVTIPNSVTSIGDWAFFDCSGLKSVHITDLAAWCKIEFSGGFANPLFYAHTLYLNGEKVTDLVIPKSTTAIKNYTFCGCSSFTSIAMPNSVTSIGSYAFYDCSGLTSVYITDLAAWCKIEFGSYDANPLYYAHSLYLNGEKVTNLVIPNSVTSIGDEAFRGCSGLTSVTIPNSVTSIGDEAFRGCSGLKSVHITDLAAWCKIEFGSYDANPLTYAHTLYLNGEKVTNLVIPNSVTTIGNYAFEYCSGLTSVTIPNSVTSIGDEAFRGCSGLTSVTIPHSVTSIGDWAFFDCSGLTSVYITDLAAWCKIKFSDESANPLYYAHSLYLNGEKVTNLVIPNSVTSIGDYAFRGCSGLTSVTIPNSVTSIGDYAFEYCSGLTSVTIGSSVESIDNSVFRGCSALSKVSFADGKTELSIGQAFASCPFSDVYIGRNLIYDSSPFSGKTTLKTATIGNSVTAIGEKAFSGCSELSTLTIGRNTAEIGDYTFSDCKNLSTIYSYAGTPPTIHEHTFENVTYAKAILYVPKGCVSIYEADPLWYPFYNILEGDYNGIDDVTTDDAAREVVGYYNLQGVRADEPWKGLNIVVYSDGTRRKIRY